MALPTNFNDVTAVLLSDGWHVLTPNTLGMVLTPIFMDPTTGQLVSPGEPWVQFQDNTPVTPVVFACRISAVLGVKLSAPITG